MQVVKYAYVEGRGEQLQYYRRSERLSGASFEDSVPAGAGTEAGSEDDGPARGGTAEPLEALEGPGEADATLWSKAFKAIALMDLSKKLRRN